MAEDKQNQSGKNQLHVLRASIKCRTLIKKNPDATRTFSAGKRRKKKSPEEIV